MNGAAVTAFGKLPNRIIKRYGLCGAHFSDDCFIDPQKTRLRYKRNPIPWTLDQSEMPMPSVASTTSGDPEQGGDLASTVDANISATSESESVECSAPIMKVEVVYNDEEEEEEVSEDEDPGGKYFLFELCSGDMTSLDCDIGWKSFHRSQVEMFYTGPNKTFVFFCYYRTSPIIRRTPL